MRLLLIEDDSDIALMLRSFLESEGHHVLWCATGQQGEAAALATRPDVILLDLDLPDVSGAEVARRLQTLPALAQTTIIMVSAAPDGRCIAAALGLPFAAKPFDLDELVRLLDQAAAA